MAIYAELYGVKSIEDIAEKLGGSKGFPRIAKDGSFGPISSMPSAIVAQA